MSVDTTQALINKLHAAREQWLDLEPGKRVRIRRPARWDALPMHRGTDIATVMGCLTGWEGFTEADLLGAALAPPDPVPFSLAVADVFIRDHIDWVDKITVKLLEMVTASFKEREATEKN